MSCTIATFYHLLAWPAFASYQKPLKAFLLAHSVRGTILLTPEGINATIAGPHDGVMAVLAHLRSLHGFADMPHKLSYAPTNPFPRTKVKLKRETIPMGVTLNLAQRGTYVKPQDWNALISQPNVMVVDTRNDYEVHIGAFANAQNPATRTFKELPNWLKQHAPSKSTPIAMYCTGGIRCEKSTAYLKQEGYEHVYHLEGGILKYLEDVPADQSLWRGACYVFDDRVAVNHDLTPATQYQVDPVTNQPVIAADLARASRQQIKPTS